MTMHLLDILALLGGALLFAKIFGGLLERIGVPTVLSELLAGFLLANFTAWTGLPFASLPQQEVVRGLSEIGVLLLLFVVGLETNPNEIRKVGGEATLAAFAGVVAPSVFAFLTIPFLVPGGDFKHTLFLAAALTATSVGITARVLRDVKKLNTVSGQIILGAAVIDDILGIFVLAIVAGLVSRGGLDVQQIGWLVIKLFGFVVCAAILRQYLLGRVIRLLRPFEVSGSVTIFLLSLCLLWAWGAEKLGLAGIIGAFAFGFALDEVHFKGYEGTKNHGLEELVKPVVDFLTPVFFLVMGMGVKVQALFNPSALLLATILIVCGVLGKLVCGLAVNPKTKSRGGDRLLVGVGMIPRGEVGLIFAALGLQLRVLNDVDYAAVITMIAVTTFIAPLFLVWRARYAKG